MKVNDRKPLRFKNRTNFFIPDKDKTFITVASSRSYESRRQKIEGYECRLYWQYKYCESVGGQTFFYTLTYADKSLPQKYGHVCFDYEDLRDLLTGGFRKILLRKYGTKFKYFVGAELGDGSGKRGYHNNPHYHILFFLEPSPYQYTIKEVKDLPVGFYQRNSKYHNKGDVKYKRVKEDIIVDVPYTPISPLDFRSLVRTYWQGFDEDKVGKRDYRTECKYGIAKEGDNLGKVNRFDACMYVAKYVCKDVRLQMKEIDIRRKVSSNLSKLLKKDLQFHKDFLYDILYPMFNIKNGIDSWIYNESELVVKLLPDLAKFFERFPNASTEEFFDENSLITDIQRINYKQNLWSVYNNYLNERVDFLVEDALKEWRNRYCNKCRISQGVGDYALEQVDLKSPSIPVPDKKKGIKYRPLNLYYYRKLYTTVVYPVMKSFLGVYHKLNSTRVLTADGIEYKVEQLKKRVCKKASDARNNISVLTEELFNDMRLSDVNTSVSCSYSYFLECLKEVDKSVDIYERYAEYKLVYEDRFFKLRPLRDSRDSAFPVLSVFDDYKNFLTPSLFTTDSSNLLLDCFLEGNSEGYLPYSEHPYFLQYLRLFSVFDLCADYFFVQNDIKNQKEAEERERVRKFHVKRNLIF